jgi:hypothetical protein
MLAARNSVFSRSIASSWSASTIQVGRWNGREIGHREHVRGHQFVAVEPGVAGAAAVAAAFRLASIHHSNHQQQGVMVLIGPGEPGANAVLDPQSKPGLRRS